MGIRKKATLRTAFWRFLILLLLGLCSAVILPFCIIILSTNMGITTNANEIEKNIQYIARTIATRSELTEMELPVGCEYVRLNKNYQVLDTTLKGKDLKRALEYASTGKKDSSYQKQYILITKDKEYVILQYMIRSQFTNAWLYEHFPSPEILLYVLMGSNCIAVCVLLTTIFARKLRRQLEPILHATEEVGKQNLDFQVGHSKIREFEEVLLSFSDMKDSLRESLEAQWRAEQLQKEQIAALAHDLKTPLTVITGNADLLGETELNEEQRQYTEYITNSSEQMQQYIKTLIDIARAATGYTMQSKTIDLVSLFTQMKTNMEALCRAKEVHLHMEIGEEPLAVFADQNLMERAILNVINNGLDYSPKGGTIHVRLDKLEEQACVSITDEGKGFSKESLLHGTEQFYMEDQGRGEQYHYGMGLYITSAIVKQHNGKLVLANASDPVGAKVAMYLPLIK
ncbi:sensor histidine kinase [Anaerosporobacter faecicola]|uniref:sensor histidine kinase n=1 Tax=Anaerosporobacter faecicola TaxID=2718714 RepID=UPI00143AE7E0|nr:HAMP domain-containing sensor histidine kinase [Anaerosporobacter faecicola]